MVEHLPRGTALPQKERSIVNECALSKSQAWNTNQDDSFYRYLIKTLNQTDKINDVIPASFPYLKRWIANDAAFIEKQKWLITKIQRRQPLRLNDPLFVSSVHPSSFFRFSRALRTRHYFSLGSHSTVLRRLYIALCLLMPEIILGAYRHCLVYAVDRNNSDRLV